jgi:hypothetical protein
MAGMNTLLWSLIVAVYAVCIWMWRSDFGGQFTNRRRRMRRVIAASTGVGTEPPKWAA